LLKIKKNCRFFEAIFQHCLDLSTRYRDVLNVLDVANRPDGEGASRETTRTGDETKSFFGTKCPGGEVSKW